MWDSGVVLTCIWGTFDLLVIKVILGSFDPKPHSKDYDKLTQRQREKPCSCNSEKRKTVLVCIVFICEKCFVFFAEAHNIRRRYLCIENACCPLACCKDSKKVRLSPMDVDYLHDPFFRGGQNKGSIHGYIKTGV